MEKENKIEYGLVFKVDWTDVLGVIRGTKKGDLKIIAFGTSEALNYSDWYLLFLGVGFGLRAKGTYGKQLRISPDMRILIWTLFGLFILWSFVTIGAIKWL